jgi:hypothetical protein
MLLNSHEGADSTWLGFADEGASGHLTVRDPIRRDCFWGKPGLVRLAADSRAAWLTLPLAMLQ